MGDRKARLAALAVKAGRTKPAPTNNAEEEESPEDPIIEQEQDAKLKFRNYAPKDEALGKDNDGDDENDNEQAQKRQRTDETKSALQEALEAAKQDAKPMAATTSVEPMAPKKINWDLKRDIRDQLAKLERRTQKAIVELLKERLENEAAAQTNSESDSDLD